MGALILLLCSLPPLAVMAIAVIHGFRTGSSTILSMLILSALVFSTSVMLPFRGNEDPAPSIRFAPPDGRGVAAQYSLTNPVSFVDRQELHATYR